jgi:hypothetical protein
VSVGNYRPNIRIGRSQTDPLARQFQRPVQKLFVDGVSGHSRRE